MTKKFFWPQIFFDPKNFFDPKIFSTQKFFGPKNFFDPKIFLIQKLFWPKNCFTKIFLNQIQKNKLLFLTTYFWPKLVGIWSLCFRFFVGGLKWRVMCAWQSYRCNLKINKLNNVIELVQVCMKHWSNCSKGGDSSSSPVLKTHLEGCDIKSGQNFHHSLKVLSFNLKSFVSILLCTILNDNVIKMGGCRGTCCHFPRKPVFFFF